MFTVRAYGNYYHKGFRHPTKFSFHSWEYSGKCRLIFCHRTLMLFKFKPITFPFPIKCSNHSTMTPYVGPFHHDSRTPSKNIVTCTFTTLGSIFQLHASIGTISKTSNHNRLKIWLVFIFIVEWNSHCFVITVM